MTLAELKAITRAGPAVVMVAKADMLALLEERARVVEKLGSILWFLQHGGPNHAQEHLKELLHTMKENEK